MATKDDDTPDINVTVNQDNDGDSTSPRQVTGSWEFQSRPIPLPEKERWFKTFWRPAAAWVYIFINLFDFVIAPVLTMILPKLIGAPYMKWEPLTTSSGGMFHLAFGAIIGVTAWGRTRERVSGLGPSDNG